MEYSVDYFIAKFEAIPEELWCMRSFSHPEKPECRCAYGHCDVQTEKGWTNEADELGEIFMHNRGSVTSCNDDFAQLIYKGSTPKQRILNFLKGLQDETN